MRRGLYLLTLVATAIWLCWNVIVWRQTLDRWRAAIAAELTSRWPPGRRMQELRKRIEDGQDEDDFQVNSRALLRAGVGFLVLRLVALALKEGGHH